MSTTIKALLWNTKTQQLERILLSKGTTSGRTRLEELYHFLDCRLIDITTRRIGGKLYDIIVDDEGLLKSDHIVSFFRNNEPQLVGNLIFTLHNEEGEQIGLQEKHFKHLETNLKRIHYLNPENDFVTALGHYE